MSIIKKALICGISGQDGSFLAQFLLKKKYNIIGTTRQKLPKSFENLKKLEIDQKINLISMDPCNFESVLNTLKKVKPDEIYFLSGQSSVNVSFQQPLMTINSITTSVLNFLEAIRLYDKSIRFYNASSSECFGNMSKGKFANEKTQFNPKSPYAAAKTSSHMFVVNYRSIYGLHCSNGILFNHESQLRPNHFVIKKIISTAQRISESSNEKLYLGRLDISRDWGWAPEYVKAMWLMLQQKQADDYVIATGKSYTLENFVQKVFDKLGLNWKLHVRISKEFIRPSEIQYSAADPLKAYKKLGWKSETNLDELISKLIKSNLDKY